MKEIILTILALGVFLFVAFSLWNSAKFHTRTSNWIIESKLGGTKNDVIAAEKEVINYINAWKEKNYSKMYRLVDPVSNPKFSDFEKQEVRWRKKDFETKYNYAPQDITIKNVTIVPDVSLKIRGVIMKLTHNRRKGIPVAIWPERVVVFEVETSNGKIIMIAGKDNKNGWFVLNSPGTVDKKEVID